MTWQKTAQTLAVFLLASGAYAHEPGVRFDAQGYGQVMLSGDTDTLVTPGARVSVDGPLAFGEGSIGRVFTELDLTALPGEVVNLVQVETFRAARVNLGIGRPIGHLDVAEQQIVTMVVGEWGFSTRLGQSTTPLQRYPRHYGVGLRIEERMSGAWIKVMYGRAEEAGERGYGQWQVHGELPLGPAFLRGDAIVSVGLPGTYDQRDIMWVSVGASIPDLIKKLK